MVLCCLSLSAAVTSSGTSILSVGDTLRVEFGVVAPQCPGGPCDVLMAVPTATGAFFAQPNGTTLFDGVEALGTQLAAYTPVFRSETSLFSPESAATVDFSSLLDGTIEGALSFALATGSMTWQDGPGMMLTLGHALSPGLVMAGTGLRVTSSYIVPAGGLAMPSFFVSTSSFPSAQFETVTANPEPGTVWLALGGGAALWWRCRRRR